jgi:hypothetical protein
LKLSLRSTFAALLAALALACAGLGAGGGGDGAHRHAPIVQQGGSLALDVQRTLELRFLHGGRPVLAGRAQRPGGIPRVEPGSQPSGIPFFAAGRAAHAPATRAHVHLPLRPPFARRLAAAHDGTLSARSTGVPPPAHA